MSLGELHEARLAKERHDWDGTCEIVAVLLNVNRDPKKKPVSAAELNPHRQDERRSAAGNARSMHREIRRLTQDKIPEKTYKPSDFR